MKILALRKKVCLVIILFGLLSTVQIKAQSEIEVDLGADLVSSYVWRGFKQAGASVQPGISASLAGFSLSAWGSTDLAGEGKKEVDFTAAYEKSGFKVAVTDYWWTEKVPTVISAALTTVSPGHYLEATLGYTLPEAFPLSLTWNTFYWEKGNKKENGDNSYSTYIELAYPFSVKGVDMGISAGFTPWESSVYPTSGFKFTSIALSASKSIKINDSFSLPVFANIIANPAVEDIHFVFGISIR